VINEGACYTAPDQSNGLYPFLLDVLECVTCRHTHTDVNQFNGSKPPCCGELSTDANCKWTRKRSDASLSQFTALGVHIYSKYRCPTLVVIENILRYQNPISIVSVLPISTSMHWCPLPLQTHSWLHFHYIVSFLSSGSGSLLKYPHEISWIERRGIEQLSSISRRISMALNSSSWSSMTLSNKWEAVDSSCLSSKVRTTANASWMECHCPTLE